MRSKNAHVELYIKGQNEYKDKVSAKDCLKEALSRLDNNTGDILNWNITSICPPLIGEVSSLGVEVDRESIGLFLSQVDTSDLKGIVSLLPEEVKPGVKKRRCKVGHEQELLTAILESTEENV